MPFHHLPLTGRDAKAKRAQERQLKRSSSASGIDLVVLARYMQILSAELVRAR